MKQAIELMKVRDGIVKGTYALEKASDFMESAETKKAIATVLDQEETQGIGSITDTTTLLTIQLLVEIAYYIYTYSGYSTGMTDTEYDKLFAILQQNHKDFVTLPELQGSIMVEHKYPVLRGTLTKIHSLETPKKSDGNSVKSRISLERWIQRTEELYRERSGKRISLKDEMVYVFPKWDGVSVILEMDENGHVIRALTRGYTKLNTAQDVTKHFQNYERKSISGKPYGLKTEVLVEEANVITFNETFEKDYAQSRAIASSIVNSLEPDPEKEAFLVVMQLRYMEETDQMEYLCPEVFNHPYIKCRLGDFDAIEAFAQEHRISDGLRCDGAVIHLINPTVKKILGRENDKNAYEVAYKFTEEYAYSTVTGIDFQVGLFGRITPVVRVEPISLKGNRITSASLGSIPRMEYLHLAKGDMVKVLYDIIPYVTLDKTCEQNRSHNTPIAPKMICPSCHHPLEMKKSILYCSNPFCDCRRKGKILNYLSKMHILEMSYQTIELLYDMKYVQTIEDLYRIPEMKKELLALPGIGKKTIDSWIKELDKRRKVEDCVFFGALGIEGCSEKIFQRVLEVYSPENLLLICKDKDRSMLTVLHGIGKKKAEQIISGINENKDLIKFLLDNEVEIYHREKTNALFHVCFTRVRDAELEEEIRQAGGAVDDAVSEHTDYVIVPEIGVKSHKVDMAHKYGTKIITLEDFRGELQKFFAPDFQK